MSPETSRAQEALRMLTPIQKEKIALSALFFYIKYLRREQFESWLRSPDPAESLKELMDLIPKEELEKDNPTIMVEALAAHPRRREIFPDFEPFTYSLFFKGIEANFNEQEFVEQVHSGSFYDDTTPADFAVIATYVAAYGGKLFPFDLVWKDGEVVIKSVVAERLKGGLGGFLMPGEIPQAPQNLQL